MSVEMTYRCNICKKYIDIDFIQDEPVSNGTGIGIRYSGDGAWLVGQIKDCKEHLCHVCWFGCNYLPKAPKNNV